MPVRSLMALMLFTLTACVSALAPSLVETSRLTRPTTADYPDADAVFLLKEVKGMVIRPSSGPDRSQWDHHFVLAILTEKGRDQANFSVPFHKEAKVVGFEARTIAPDGTVTPVAQSEIKDSKGQRDQDSGYNVRTFAFPRVEVGSIVELSMVTEVPWATVAEFRFISGEHPIKKYRVQIEGNPDVYYRVRSYNVPKERPWTVAEEGPGWRLTWGMDDIPPRSREAYRGPAKAHEPFWRFGVQALGGAGQQVYQVTATWDSTYKYRGKQLYSERDEHFEDFQSDVDVSACRTDRCKIEAGLDWLRAKLPFKSVGGYPGRKAKAVVAAGEATGVEKTRILHHLLDGWEIKSRFGFFHAYQGGRVDREFPEWRSLDRVLLHIQPSKDFPDGLWVDPACEYCGLGQLPPWLKDTEVLLLDYRYEGIDTEPTFFTKFVQVAGEQPRANQWSADYKVQVDEGGKVSVNTTIRRAAMMAQHARRWIRKNGADDWTKSADRFAKNCIPTAVVTSQAPYVFDARQWEASRSVQFEAPGFAVTDRDHLIVPLSFFATGYDDIFRSKSRTRPVYFTTFDENIEQAEITAPPGYVVASVPKAGHAKGPVNVAVDVSHDQRTVRIRRQIAVTPGRYDAEQYSTIRSPLDLWRRIDTEAVTFVRAAADVRADRSPERRVDDVPAAGAGVAASER